jgi:hypothetical protein
LRLARPAQIRTQPSIVAMVMGWCWGRPEQ